MSEYERFEAAQGDPWSTEPVGDYPRQPRESDTGSYHDESQVLARMPHVGDEPSSDQYSQYGQGRGSHRRRRSSSGRAAIPAPVWVLIGMGLVVVIGFPFVLANKSHNETAMDGPGWEVEMPAPDADVAPKWEATAAGSAWPQPGSLNQGVPPTTTVTAEPAAAPGWAPSGELIGAPAGAPYALNAADVTAPIQGDRTNSVMPLEASPYPATAPLGQAPGAWAANDPSSIAAAPPTPAYQDTQLPSQPGYPPTAGAATGPWSDPMLAPGTPAAGVESSSPMPSAYPWQQSAPAPSLAAPQPENVMPGYGTYPTPQQNPYVTSPSNVAVGTAPGYPAAQGTLAAPQYPSVAPSYPAAGYPAATYPTPGYPQTAMSPRTAPTMPLPAAPAYSSQPLAPSNPYPPATTAPYAPQTMPAAPGIQPYYGSGASTATSPQSVARLNGTIQEPATRQAYDDRARPSYY